jgi:fatty acid desaturase
MTIGVGLALAGFWRAEARLLLTGDRGVWTAWGLHMLAAAPVIGGLLLAGVNPLIYALCVACPALSLIHLRSFIEHRAAEAAEERSAIVEAGWFWRLLFLNNGLHAIHHAHPTVAWHRLPALWRERREAVLARNAHYHVPGGYGEVARRYLFKAREPVPHPFMRRGLNTVAAGPGQTPGGRE